MKNVIKILGLSCAALIVIPAMAITVTTHQGDSNTQMSAVNNQLNNNLAFFYVGVGPFGLGGGFYPRYYYTGYYPYYGYYPYRYYGYRYITYRPYYRRCFYRVGVYGHRWWYCRY